MVPTISTTKESLDQKRMETRTQDSLVFVMYRIRHKKTLPTTAVHGSTSPCWSQVSFGPEYFTSSANQYSMSFIWPAMSRSLHPVEIQLQVRSKHVSNVASRLNYRIGWCNSFPTKLHKCVGKWWDVHHDCRRFYQDVMRLLIIIYPYSSCKDPR